MCKAWATVRNEMSSLYTRARMSHRKFWWKPPELPVKRDQTVGLVSQLGFTGTSGARTGTSGPYRNFRTEPRTILSHASARANYTNRNFRCLIGTSGEYRNFRKETGTKYSHADSRGHQRPELLMQLTGTSGLTHQNFWSSSLELSVQLSSLLSFDKSTFYPYFAN
jgi:hypothetical protein